MSSQVLQLQRTMQQEFDLVPLTNAQWRRLSGRERKRERKREERRRVALGVVDRVWRRYAVLENDLTESQAVEFAMAGIPLWMWLVRPFAMAFMKRVAVWTWKWLQDQQKQKQAGVC